ncbi:type IV secretion system DNA-binding domain-containing protein [Terriglobus albidus]|uniref:type IV secretion system DNA-binding domain-containing protein n=1 Tax=Terriglobus albidus TaxID=1592106 RepID=UPI0021DF60CC|nr:type IV secretion system DNA-binding domain-containing protein [Terriglobus albidus]
MPTQWGRKETIIWPPHSPIYTYGATFLAVVLTGAFIYMRFAFATTPLQQFYTPVYVRASLAAQLGKTRKDKYRMLFEAGKTVPAKPAVASDIMPGVTEQPGARPIPLTLTETAARQGYIALYRGAETSYFDVPLRDYLRQNVYGGSTLWDIYKQPLAFGLLALLAQLPFSIRKDVKRRRELKYGRRLKGPVLLTPKQFNGAIAGEGVGFKTTEAKALMRIPARYESQHIELMGDTGAGKTTLIMQILRQIQGRGHTAIVYDPACEFIQRFYDGGRGDIVLNPLDKRCPYWGPAEELRSKAEAKTLAKSLYQPTDTLKDEFFTKTPQKIFAHLLRTGPTPHQLAEWMANPAEIDKRVAGTEMATMIAKDSPPQRNGVLSSLGLVADSLRMLPTLEEAKNRRWCATEWAEGRKGWIFITSRPTERDALQPLHSLWIDWLVLRLLSAPKEHQTPVWFVLDELASLQRLPQLHTAITENRKSKNPLVLGFQGKAQLETIYGHLAEVMLSQPATKIFLKTTEPKAAEWVSNAIGKVEIERMKETHFDGTRNGKNFTIDRQVEPLVLDSEISGLEERRAYLKLGNHVARFAFDYLDLPTIATDFERRIVADDELEYDPLSRLKEAVRPPAVDLEEEDAANSEPEETAPKLTIVTRATPVPPAATQSAGDDPKADTAPALQEVAAGVFERE